MTVIDLGEPLLYEDGDTSLCGELYRPAASANGRAVLLVHEADGIGGNVRRHCHRLSQLGYMVLAADIHGGGQVLKGEAMQTALERFRIQPDLVRRRVNAGFEALLSVAKVTQAHGAAIGFCLGGFAVLELARSGAPVAAIASFHGLLTTARPAIPRQVKARIAVFTGGCDPLVPALDVASFQHEMSAAVADWQMTVYGKALHSFTNQDVDSLGDPRMAYDEAAHRLSWNALIDFLEVSLPQHRE